MNIAPWNMMPLHRALPVQLHAAALQQSHLNLCRVEAIAFKFLKHFSGLARGDHILPSGLMTKGGPKSLSQSLNY